MNRLTLGSLRPTIARVLNVCADSSKVQDYLNEAQARLMAKGKWVGTVCNYRFCSNENCIVLPRQIEVVESFAVCQTPGTVQNGWYSFNPSGLGLIAEDACMCGSMLIDQGIVCCYDSLDNSNNTSRIQVSTVVPEAVGARILIQGWDQNANWIRTIDALTGQYVEGEYVDIVNTRTTVNYFSGEPTGIIKPVTNGTVILSEKDDTTSLVVKTIAQFESDETAPSYRKYLMPGMSEGGSCCGSRHEEEDDDEECDSKYVTVRAKLRHIPVRIDTDWMTIQSIGALKTMVQAILKEDRNLFSEAQAYEAAATKMLQDELSSFEGDGALPTLKTANSAGWGGGVSGVIGGYGYTGYY